ncbi:hypothetical protein NZD89_11840 [Alicyclobacillus fastidiosus]|uniref:Uncharacterized protein n=1 Tax=Alicyclobacillus fastidiosus TaxID=392011 RepID=A0ABY6ZNI5_9BACL|nr:hypothetical protein [Alicyclobacillus fastidiosus]WAH44002.1 hypothetical protein NZD89_11840 [Alicyclobacillus fastidiosus]GMA60283.1 hypothetical protein GCM10025859_07230 [Alicyclobacillus fastidiosus]
MEHQGVMEQVLKNYELANDALMHTWGRLDEVDIDALLQKQQERLRQIAQRAYGDGLCDDAQSELLLHTTERLASANQHLCEHWEAIPFGERRDLLQKQWNRIQQLRNQLTH